MLTTKQKRRWVYLRNLKELRLKKGLSQEQLAKQLNISSVAVCQYELGKRSPNIEMLKKLAQVLDCSVDELLKDIG